MGAMLISKSPSAVVKPSSEPVSSATGGQISLTSYDMPNVRRSVTAFLVFEHPIHDPAETIKRGLSLALVPYYPISGRLAANDDGVFTTIDCTGETGVPFVTASADAALKDVNLHRHLGELAVFYPAAGHPLLLVQVTVFSCGGFVVGLTWDHSVADGAGMSQFLRAVGELARGMPSPTVVPVRHDPAMVAMPLSFRRVGRLLSSFHFQPSPLILLHHTLPHSLVSSIKNEFSTVNGGQPCTVLDAITAVLWRCRTRAVMDHPSDPAVLGFVADTRRHAGARDGYYGNCSFLAPPVMATNGVVAGGDIIDVIRMIRRTKDDSVSFSVTSLCVKEENAAAFLRELANFT